MKKNKIISLIIFSLAVICMIFLPAIIKTSVNVYTSVVMKKTGSLPMVKTYEKLKKLVESNKNYRYKIDLPIVDIDFDIAKSRDKITAVNGPVFQESKESAVDYNNPSMVYSSSSGVAASTNVSSDYSSTNIQVAGVDEADILKNDGKYIYTISNNKLAIIDAFPADEMRKVSEIDIDEEYRLVELYVNGDKLFLITDTYNSSRYNYSETVQTKMLVYNIIDRTNPELLKTFEVKGVYTSSRKIADKIYVFTSRNVYQENGNYVVPQYRESSEAKFTDVSLTDIQYVPDDNYSLYTQILAFDMATPLDNPKMVTYLGEGSNNIYMSQNTLYMAQSKYSKTIVYKFSLDTEYPRFEAQGEVEGTILNQFAMDEFDGNFRIATTNGSKNSVFILGPSMHKLGSLLNIAPGEQIKSVRFEGNRGYVVTFRNTDPLFVIDLTQVRKPKVLGELKVQGYSAYIHTYDENHLIGFGYDGTEFGINGKLKIAMFDVTDVRNPKLMFNEEIDANASELLTNHKSLLFSKEKDLMAFAVGTYSYEDNDIGKVYTITLENGFELRGEIIHKDDVARMLFMDDILYGVSEKTVSAHNIETIEEIKSIEL